MNGNKWREKPAQNKAKKSCQLFVKNCSLGGLNALNDQCFRSYIRHSSKLLEFAKDKALRYTSYVKLIRKLILAL